ncbi:MAG: aminopeptidase P family N-terminal domain-containing protein [Clostridium fessum]
MQKEHLYGMFISRPVNVKYVSHYTGEDSCFLSRSRKNSSDRSAATPRQVLRVPGLHDFELERHLRLHRKGTCLRGGKGWAKTIGYEAAHLTAEQYQNLQSEVKAERGTGGRHHREFRSIKKTGEISACVSPQRHCFKGI